MATTDDNRKKLSRLNTRTAEEMTAHDPFFDDAIFDDVPAEEDEGGAEVIAFHAAYVEDAPAAANDDAFGSIADAMIAAGVFFTNEDPE